MEYNQPNNQIWGKAFQKRDFKTKQLNSNQLDVMKEGSVKANNGEYVKMDIKEWISKCTQNIKITIFPNDKQGNPNKTKNNDYYYNIRIMEVSDGGSGINTGIQKPETQKEEKPQPEYIGEEKPPF
jgi:hypothetical protein